MTEPPQQPPPLQSNELTGAAACQRYKLETFLEEGGAGNVYPAHVSDGGPRVAIKEIVGDHLGHIGRVHFPEIERST